MDFAKLNLIKQDVLKEEWSKKRSSNEFCGLFVDGTGKLTFEAADAPFWSFQCYSQYTYPIYLFVSSSNNTDEIKKIVHKYPNTKVYNIPPLKDSLKYNEWFFNYPWFLLDPKHTKVLSFQEDGFLIKSGWEDFVTKGKYNFIGASWRSEIQALATETLKSTWGFNGGMSYRTTVEVKKCLQFVNDRGGQHKFFKGVKINGEVRQENSWLAEDLMFVSTGFTYGFFKDVSIEDAKKFSHEPIELGLYMDKKNENRPFAFHKVDY